MAENKRQYLADGSTLLLSRKRDGSAPEQYTILKCIGAGGSTVCYDARRTLPDGTVKTGKLKEFYPCDSADENGYYTLERMPNGQLIPGCGTVRKFGSMCESYLNAYRLLWQAEEDPENEVLKRYIQEGEVLYGCPTPRPSAQPTRTDRLAQFFGLSAETAKETLVQPTVYIWSSGFSGETFEDYLRELRQDPKQRPEEKLRTILSVLVDLTDCIKALHEAGLLHLDIKPSNFMLPYNSDRRADSTISLYDINTLRHYSASDAELSILGTPGYHAPETCKNDRSDIYSLGATLFHAVIVSDTIPDGLYQDTYYPNLAQIVQNSKVFKDSVINSDPILLEHVTQILRGCLAYRASHRYESCSLLKQDLLKAIQHLDRLCSQQQEYRQASLADPRLLVQKLLYEHPLYECGTTAQDLNVLLLGVGSYGQAFLDSCLQVGQMIGTRLHILAVSDDPAADKKAYLDFRPALPEFVSVDGSLPEDTAYATLNFLYPSQLLPEDDPSFRLCSLNQRAAEEIADASLRTQQEYHYVFVTLENSALSRNLAQAMSDALCSAWNTRYPVAYTQSGEETAETAADSLLHPVWTGRPLAIDSIDKDLAEMAFNTHMSWMSAMNSDIPAERERLFAGKTADDRYNFASSVSFVLSIQYKLHSLGLACRDLPEAAQLFQEQVLDRRASNPAAQKQFDQLVALEHRRWVLDRVTAGWRAPRTPDGALDLQSCVDHGAVRDKERRTHPCLVRSGEAAPLRGEDYKANHHAKWDDGLLDPSLDELDQMSIQLHRCFHRSAEAFRRSTSYQDDLEFLREQLSPDNKDALQKLGQYEFALKNILHGSESYTRQYGHYHEQLEEAAGQLPGESSRRFLDRLNTLKKLFFPVIESNLYRDYKANDDLLVERIPYILTYRHPRTLAAVFEDGRRTDGRKPSEAAFSNAAAATMLSPDQILYFYCFDADSRADLLHTRLCNTLNYFNTRKTHCTIHLLVCCLNEVRDTEAAALENALNGLRGNEAFHSAGAAQLGEIRLETAADHTGALQIFRRVLEETPVDLFDCGNQLFSVLEDNFDFFQVLKELRQPRFQFDWPHKKFISIKDCTTLHYVQNDSFLRVNDMFALMSASDRRFNLPEFADDYETLWKICSSSQNRFDYSIKNWNRLCLNLADYDKKQPALVSITKLYQPNAVFRSFQQFLPEYTFPAVKKLLQEMADLGLASADSTIVRCTSDTCRLTLTAPENYLPNLQKIFHDPHILLSYYDPHIELEADQRTYSFRCCSLQVDNAAIEYLSDNAQSILNALQENGYIQDLQMQLAENRASFAYSSPRIKHLLTHAGEILELYAYYDILKTGYFDDVVTGYTFSWAKGAVQNELDLVLTKGFQSMIVECKAVEQLKADFYFKLDSLGQQFGVGTTLVMLSNTYYENHPDRKAANALQKDRGSQMGILTITRRSDLENIGQVLANEMKQRQSVR